MIYLIYSIVNNKLRKNAQINVKIIKILIFKIEIDQSFEIM